MSTLQKPFKKCYDMPPGMDVCVSYEMFLRHIIAGRAVGVVPIIQPDGIRGTYVYSGETPDRAVKHKTPNDPSGWGVEMVTKAREKARAAGCKTT